MQQPRATNLPQYAGVPRQMVSGVQYAQAPTMVQQGAPVRTAVAAAAAPTRIVGQQQQPVYRAAAPLAASPGSLVGGTRVLTGQTPASYTMASPTGGYVKTTSSQPIIRPLTQTATIRTVAPAVRTTQPNLGPTYTQQSYEDKHKDDPQLQNLKEIRKSCGLKEVPVQEGLAMLNQAGGEDGKLSRDQFMVAYTELLAAKGIPAPTEQVKHAVFDLFDRDDNNIVDRMELICGISLLCAGSEDDKIQAVFDVFDMDGDGFISMDEMYKFLTSVFKVVLTPNVMGVMNSMGVTVESPEDLASVTALECFKTADLNHDGKLSITEFKSWFYAPRNDPSFLFSPVRKLLN
eukprot:TRINITY_DN25566_c0_g1_i1.p1 TRINITY_DN25566_c0_g1~~TRINITY_DN25566_c0_g1_i1.p1  ORF type:complete len:347 (+),score=79.17 TRINITY_DN25566_c0_g1_i1:87-1127(+)